MKVNSKEYDLFLMLCLCFMSKYKLLQAKEQEVETKKAVNKMVQGNATKGKVEEKLKVKIVCFGVTVVC